MTHPLDPSADRTDDEARLSDLAARYFDLWQENWTAWLAPQEEDDDDEQTRS